MPRVLFLLARQKATKASASTDIAPRTPFHSSAGALGGGRPGRRGVFGGVAVSRGGQEAGNASNKDDGELEGLFGRLSWRVSE